MKALGKALRAEREKRGWSQEDLCNKSGLDRTYISGVELGSRSPNVRTLLRVTSALNIPFSKLVLAAEALDEAG